MLPKKSLTCYELSFLLERQEAVAGVLVHFAVSRQVARSAFTTFGILGEEVNGLGLATAQSNFGFVQLVGNAFTVSMFVAHEVPP